MGQSKLHSFIESLTNLIIGNILAIIIQLIIFPMYGIPVTFFQVFQISIIFTFAGLVRSYILRRIFNNWRKSSN
jgi:hypothetical protein